MITYKIKHKNKINNFLARSKPGIKLAEDLTSFIKGLKKQRVTSNKLDIIPAMKDLYEYNKMIYEGIEKNNFIPISLKLFEAVNFPLNWVCAFEDKELMYWNSVFDTVPSAILAESIPVATCELPIVPVKAEAV